MKSNAAALVLALVFLLGAGSSGSGSGLRGTVLLDPGYPVCPVDRPCTRPAKHMPLRFLRHGRVIARVRTDSKGRFRISLAPRRTYVVSTSSSQATVRPRRTKILAGEYRRVTFRVDTGIR